MTELQRFIVKIDAEVLVGLRPEHTTAENNVNLGVVDGVAMLRRSDAYVSLTGCSGCKFLLTRQSLRSPKRKVAYWVRLVKAANLLHDMLALQESLKMRHIQYIEVCRPQSLRADNPETVCSLLDSESQASTVACSEHLPVPEETPAPEEAL